MTTSDIDVPVAPGPFHEDDQELEQPTPAQRLCYGIPLDECERHPDCHGCSGFTPATRGSRA